MIELPVHVTSDDVHAHPRHTGRGWLDLLLALSAIFISVVSLAVAIEHGRTDRQLVAANSWPFLQVNARISDTAGMRFWLVNEGIGPAKLETFQMLYDGRPVASVTTLLERCCGLSADKAIQARQLPGGINTIRVNQKVFRPGQEGRFLDVPNLPDSAALERALSTGTIPVSFQACYCSVFDECWMSNLRDLHPRPVAQCPTTVVSFNETSSGG